MIPVGGSVKLTSVTISNFRGYLDEQSIAIDDLTTIVGRNDVGKSTILEALAIFFGDPLIRPDSRDLNVDAASDSFEISCTFDDLPPEIVIDANAVTSLEREFLVTRDKLLKIKKTWNCSGGKPREDVFITCEHPSVDGLNDLLLLTNANLKSRVKDMLDSESADEVNKASNPSMRTALWNSYTDLKMAEQEIPVTKEDSKKIWEKIKPLLPYFALFQSDRASRDSDAEVQNPMKFAIDAALAEQDVQDSLATVVNAVRTHATELASRTHAVLNELDPALARSLEPDFKSDPKWASLFNMTLADSNGISINKRGSGVRRMVLVSFFRAEAERRLEHEAERGARRSVIYAIEEPETSQHPNNQKVLLESFDKMAASSSCQVILTTHSPGIVGRLPVGTLRYVSKGLNEATYLDEVDETILDRIASDLGVLPDSGVEVIICVEGPTDVEALRNLSHALASYDSSIVDLSTDHRFAFVPLGGGNLKQWVSEHYLRKLGLPEFHLYDGDNDIKKSQASVDKVNARGDRSSARVTRRREIENYLHPSVIKQVLGLDVDFGPRDDVPQIIADASKATKASRNMGTDTVKRTVSKQCFGLMTPELLGPDDAFIEVREWFSRLRAMVE